MKKLLINQNQQLRNGWWIVIFIALTALSRVIYPHVSEQFQHWGVTKDWLSPLSALFIVAVTWICMRLRHQSLAEVGLKINGKWFKQFSVGIGIGSLQIALIVSLISLSSGVQFTVNTEVLTSTLFMGFYVFLFSVLMEEILFRGFIFQRLLDGVGIWPAQISMAALFAIGHLTNPEVNPDTLIFATLDIALGAILFGLAYIKTKSLALPVGLHLGWNWTQGNIFGFSVSGYEQSGILNPTISEQPAWITGAGFGPEATLFAVLIDLAFIILLWRWRGAQDNIKQEGPVTA
jgi:membrane protease YdiL (CAAX protease family)